MKAWQFDYEEFEGKFSTIIYAETENEARTKAVDCTNGIKYKDVKLKRVMWADKYGDFNNIPEATLIEHGWVL